MIQSKANKTYKYFKSLITKKGRQENSAFLIEGEHLIQEAQKAELEIKTIGLSFQDDYQLSLSLLKTLSEVKTPQNKFALVKFAEVKQIKKASNKILWLSNLSDPGNFGTLLRSALAFGFTKVYYENFDPYAPKVLRAAQGAHFHLELVEIKEENRKKTFKNFKDENFKIFGTYLHSKAQKLNKMLLTDKIVLVLGNEGQGISQELVKYFDHNIKIEADFESLNVSVAGAILMHYLK